MKIGMTWVTLIAFALQIPLARGAETSEREAVKSWLSLLEKVEQELKPYRETFTLMESQSSEQTTKAVSILSNAEVLPGQGLKITLQHRLNPQGKLAVTVMAFLTSKSEELLATREIELPVFLTPEPQTAAKVRHDILQTFRILKEEIAQELLLFSAKSQTPKNLASTLKLFSLIPDAEAQGTVPSKETVETIFNVLVVSSFILSAVVLGLSATFFYKGYRAKDSCQMSFMVFTGVFEAIFLAARTFAVYQISKGS